MYFKQKACVAYGKVFHLIGLKDRLHWELVLL